MKIREWYKDAGLFKRINIYLKYITSRYKKRISLDCYLYYGFDYLSKKEADEILFDYEIEQLENQFNDDEKRNVFNSKKEFNKKFCDYISRKIIYADECSFDVFLAFFKECGEIIVKPDNQYGGHGISLFKFENYKDENDLKTLFEKLKNSHYIIEEKIENSNAYKEIYSGCLNTIRINTLVMKDGSVKAFSFINQWGSNGSVVDNDEYSGIWSFADLTTGIITKVEKDAITGKTYERHPDSEKMIVGFQNEKCKEIISLATKLAKIEPQCRLIGWDLAVLDNGKIELIEGNVTPELGIFQASTHQGLKSLFYTNI